MTDLHLCTDPIKVVRFFVYRDIRLHCLRISCDRVHYSGHLTAHQALFNIYRLIVVKNN